MTDYLDISFTVKESELMGRRLLRDLKTGQIYYDPTEPIGSIDRSVNNFWSNKPKITTDNTEFLVGKMNDLWIEIGKNISESMEPVEPPPEASVEQPSADPAPPIKKSVAKRKKVQNGA